MLKMSLSNINLINKRKVIIIVSVIVLQIIFGFDPKFCIVNYPPTLKRWDGL